MNVSFDSTIKYFAGPSKVTIGDFWQMVWQEKIDVTVMLTNPVENGKVDTVFQNVLYSFYSDYTKIEQFVC